MIGSLKIYKISEKVFDYIVNTMEKWKMELTAEEEILTEVKM